MRARDFLHFRKVQYEISKDGVAVKEQIYWTPAVLDNSNFPYSADLPAQQSLEFKAES